MKIYLAGPMRGKPYFNAPAFRRWTETLRGEGHEVFSPVENTETLYPVQGVYDNEEGDEDAAGIDGRVVFAADLAWICAEAECVALMPGWTGSKGATAECAVAKALGLRIMEL